MNNKKRIIVSVSDIEDQYITEQAQKCGMSKSSYIREQTLTGQVVNSLPEAKIRSIIAELYVLMEQVEDGLARNLVKEVADLLWQSLK